MCLIFFSINNHPTYKLIVAGNRDEFYNRKTQAANFWDDHPTILGGRDMEAMGTWLAITKTGKLSMLTNYRDPQNINPKAPSRGHLVSDYLLEDENAEQYLKRIALKGKLYNGFNLLVGNQNALWYYSNYKNEIQKLDQGFYGLSNHLLETPWPKVVRGKEKLKPIFAQSTIQPSQLLDVLNDDERAADEELPHTGLTIERERALSSMFIKTENYGSRCSTVILIDKTNHVVFSERVYNLQSFDFTTKTYSFKI